MVPAVKVRRARMAAFGPPVEEERGWEVGIVVPARSEQATIVPCLESLLRAVTVSRCPGTIVLVADSCTDRTAFMAEATLGDRGQVLECEVGTAGAARRLGTEWLLDHVSCPPSGLWLAATDADSHVPPRWLATQLRLAATGVAAVAGVVRLDPLCDPRLVERFRAGYTLHADGTHPHVHGANLGVRADAYLDVGGWDVMATGEDHALWTRLERAGWIRVSSVDTWVTTSGRRAGRAPHGFSADLAALELAL